MHNCVLYRQIRRKNSMLFSMERDFLCVCMPETSGSVKANTFSGFSAAVPAGSKSDGLKWYWPPIRAIKCLPLPIWCIILSTMCERLSKILTTGVFRLWNPSPGRADRMNSPRTTRPLSQKRPSVRRTCWVARLSGGLWRSCESTCLPKRLSRRSASKPFAVFCMRKRSSFDGPKPGKNATIPSSSLKKTDSPVCKPAGRQRPHDLLRRVWSFGNPASAGAGLVRNRPSQTPAGHIYPNPWRAALAGFLRCAQEEAVGLYAAPKAASGVPGSAKAFTEEISAGAANSSDFGQLLAAPQGESSAVLPKEQYSPDLDANQCFMAQSDRMPVYSCQGIRDSRNRLSKSSGTKNFLE
ncbi:hypothetical protein L21SP3_00460 [Sedimentisphaera cyanobacteriorum]|uniref:Uncharacterized protein n=1 Tax=Sedimentisphaera cyanobacteriorum TaxID=1940790 RepID=A0A1Q2HN01_9BACT|nr:hypothetical protein L21SP3_00460 [Sedimentisphaera cyanobacteriorum]